MAARVLVLDDNEEMRRLLAKFLESEGYSFDMAESMATAQNLVESDDYSVILLDKNMPGIDDKGEGGMDFLRYLRTQGSSSEVIMMTGYATLETAVEAMKLGAFDYIQKPFSLSDLAQKIRRIIDYRSFIEADYTIEVYKGIRGEILKLVESRSQMSDKDLDQTLLSLNEEIDKLFRVLKASEKIIMLQRESLASLAQLTEQLRMEMSEAGNSNPLLEEICRVSWSRL